MQMDESLAMADLRPRPDPTRLTTEQLFREIASLKEVVFTRLDGMDRALTLSNEVVSHIPSETSHSITHLRELVWGRIDAIDKATELLPTQVSQKIDALEAVHSEKFLSIGLQFKERDVRTEQRTTDSKTAVDAALQAAKDAVTEQNKSSSLAISKSEAATIKQIDQILILIATQAKAFEDKVTDMKERLTRIEGKGEGKNASWGYLLGGGGLLLTVLSLIVAAIALFHR
jgi:phage I-like protein